MRSTFTFLTALVATAAAKKCINQTVPVQISSRNGVFNLAVPQTNLDAVEFVLNMTQQGRNYTETALTGYDTISGTYNISTEFCMPTQSNGTHPTVQVLTHGVGFDKTYWDFSYADFNYSYVNVATDDYKYCTLTYDRLGIGNSSHGEPLNEIQSFLEVEALAALTGLLRNGSFPGVNHTFNKVVHVGHSFGSAQTYSLADKYPHLTDGIVLTGFSMNGSFVSSFLAGGNYQQAYLNQPLRFGNISGAAIENFLGAYAEGLVDYLTPLTMDLTSLPPSQRLPKGYLVSSDAEANYLQFFKPHYFSNAVLAVAEATKQPVTEGEALTLASLPMMNAFTGPVFVIAGDADVPYCGGNCTNTGGVAPSFQATVKMNFPSVDASNFSSYVQPNTGHGINLHYNSTAAYRVWNNFLGTKNLQSS